MAEDGIESADSRHGQSLHLAHQRGLRVLGDHEPRVHARVVGQEGRQAVAAVLVEQPVGAALGDGGEVRGGDGEEVQDVRDRGAVEVAVGLHAPVGQHDRVVDGRGQLALGDEAGVRHGVASGAA